MSGWTFRLTLLALSLAIVACKKKAPGLPDQIEYKVSFYDARTDHLPTRIFDLAGAELVMNDKPVAKLEQVHASNEVYASWRGPMAGINEVVAGKFVARGQGACGPGDVPLGETPASWKGLKDEQLAPYLDRGKTLSFSFHVTLPRFIYIFIDRGSSTATVRVGKVPIEKGAKDGFPIALAGCTEPVPVVVDGKKVGELDMKSPVYLITLEPNVCHSFQTVGYGSYESLPPSHYPAEPITPLGSAPVSFLKRAEDAIKVGGGGTVTSELLREACP